MVQTIVVTIEPPIIVQNDGPSTVPTVEQIVELSAVQNVEQIDTPIATIAENIVIATMIVVATRHMKDAITVAMIAIVITTVRDISIVTTDITTQETILSACIT
ncbi:hypothetical protein GCM10023150_03420 [Kangiella taiwanensis]|uniref:Uncharacterized protein n=1 Tax=Kangiella taiwanensis TaxID=1079179 RepID=A0ABP8HTI8_9GAMM